MSLRSVPARRLAPVGALAAALLLGACGTGQQAQTYREKAAGDTTNVNVGPIAVRNLAVKAPQTGQVLPQGTSARVSVTLANSSTEPDTLVSVTTPAAASVEVVGPSATLTVPADGTTGESYSLLLQGLTRDLPTGTWIDMTLNFAQNGSKQVLVPVQVTPDGAPRPTGSYVVPEVDSAGKPLTGEGG